MLRIATLSHAIKTTKKGLPLQVLKDIDLRVKRGDFLSVVGPNGCGKSTLLRIIAGLDRPTRGAIWLGEQKIIGPGMGIGMVFQEIALLPWKTVFGNIKFGLAHVKHLNNWEKGDLVSRYLHDFGLAGFEKHYPHQLSGGMRQKVALARTLINDPDVLLMDEPFAALDSFTRNQLHDFLISVWQETGKTIVFVTHNIDEAVYLSRRIVLLSRRPARVEQDIFVDIPFPRDRTGEMELHITREILAFMDIQASELPE